MTINKMGVRCIAMLLGVKLKTYKAGEYLKLLSEYEDDESEYEDDESEHEERNAREKLQNLIEKNFDGVTIEWYTGCLEDEENSCGAYLVLDEIPSTDIEDYDAPSLDFDECADLYQKYSKEIKKILKIFGEEDSKICIHTHVLDTW